MKPETQELIQQPTLGEDRAGESLAATAEGRSFVREGAALFALSALVLFLELAAIRWFSSYIPHLAFFTNLVLMAAFLGMSVGCLAPHRSDFLQATPSLIHLSVLGALIFYAATSYFWVLDVEVQTAPTPELVYFGSERAGEAAQKLAVPLLVLLPLLFGTLALWFLGLGALLGESLNRWPNRLLAYSVNVSGSLCGMAAFCLCSYGSLPPVVWFGGAFLLLTYFLSQRQALSLANACLLGSTLVLVGLAGWRTPEHRFYWSPYYLLRLDGRNLEVEAGPTSHQRMASYREGVVPYYVPFALRRLVGLPGGEDCLIIGAGTGNDASVALVCGARRVRAVEIDPVLVDLGRRFHPDRPYDDPRVDVIITDGRAFLNRDRSRYDLVIYGLVDSLRLQSAYGTIRLETYLYTQEAFALARRRLKDGGLFVVSNFFREGWIVHRLASTMEAAFGQKPLVLAFPSRETIGDSESGQSYITVLAVGEANTMARLREALGHPSTKCLWWVLGPNSPVEAHECGVEHRLKEAQLVPTRVWEPPTDDWPFLYLKERRIPIHNLWQLISILAVSVFLLWRFSPAHRLSLEPAFLFLGAGFMLMETKSIVQFAQLIGSTWVVNSVVLALILLLILGANTVVAWRQPRRTGCWYGGLLVTLGLNAVVPLRVFEPLPSLLATAAAGTFLLAPVFFGSVLFAIYFRDTPNPSLAFGANIAGAAVGGVAEYVSLYTGYRALVVVAALFYTLAALGRRARP